MKRLGLVFALFIIILSGCQQTNIGNDSPSIPGTMPGTSSGQPSVTIPYTQSPADTVPLVQPPGTIREPYDNTNNSMAHTRGEIICGAWSDFGPDVVIEYRFNPDTNEESLMVVTAPKSTGSPCSVIFFSSSFQGFTGLLESLRVNSFQLVFDRSRMIWFEEAMHMMEGAFLSSVNAADYNKAEIIELADYTAPVSKRMERLLIHLIEEKEAYAENLIPYVQSLENGYFISIKNASGSVLSDAMKRSVQPFDSVYQRYN